MSTRYQTSFTFGDPDTYDKRGNRQVPYSKEDLEYISQRCALYESQRQNLAIMKKLHGLEEEIVQSR